PQAVWINPPTKESTAQNGVGTTIAIADDPRVAQQSEEIGVVAAIGGITPYAITDPTDEVLHYMPTASVPNSLTRSVAALQRTTKGSSCTWITRSHGLKEARQSWKIFSVFALSVTSENPIVMTSSIVV
ncbi:MAG: hypothetical protein OEV71_11995, partial [Nitrospira sp.]|nr:hypothetical protein [Nitrospira sp.]